MSVLYFAVLVGVLVVIHELGHFVAAKAMGVKVLRLSIGYGRHLWRRRIGETEYQLAVFPIGGYVRILGVEGDSDETDDHGRSFAARPLWQRLVIVFAGPAANLILPIFIYFALYAGHHELRAAVIGDVVASGPAERAGLLPGDRISEIDGRAVRYFDDVEQIVKGAANRELHVRVIRNGKPVERYVTPIADVVRSRSGEIRNVGRIGITHAPYIPVIGILDRQSPVAVAGLHTGDLLISIGGAPVRNWGDVTELLGKTPRRTSVVYFRGTEVPGIPQVRLLAANFADVVPVTLVDDTLKRTFYTGIERAEMFVAHVDPGSPAAATELRPGDLITSLDDVPLAHWSELDQRLQAEPGKTFHLSWKRPDAAGEIATMTGELTQVRQDQLDEYGHPVKRLVFGARNDVARGAGAMTPIEGRVGYAISRSVERTADTVGTMVGSFGQILAGSTPSEAIGGPLTMYRVASVSGSRGLDSFLLLIALISVNLGLINLLPVPMLDGGHLVVFAAEALMQRSLSDRERDRVQYVGLVVLALIFLLAMRNDIVRYVLR